MISELSTCQSGLPKISLVQQIRKQSAVLPYCMAESGRKGLKTQTHSQPASSRASSESNYSATEPVQPTPLRLVVQDAVRRWFAESHKEATKGDVKQQALLGQMLIEGYGCKQNAELGRVWAEKARKRGYRMAGVYCEI